AHLLTTTGVPCSCAIFFSNASRPPGRKAADGGPLSELHPARAASSTINAVRRRTRRRMAEAALTPFRSAVCFNRYTPSVPQGPGPVVTRGTQENGGAVRAYPAVS